MSTQEQSGANPYQAPNAEVAPQHAGSGAWDKNGRSVPIGRGLAWIGAGWDAFKVQPGAWILFSIVFAAVMFALSILPIINLFSLFITPVLIGGVMLACREAEAGHAPAPGLIFAGFSSHLGKLALVGLLYLIGIVVIGLLAGVLSSVALVGVAMGTGFAGISLGMILIVLLALALMIPLMMAFYYAPALIVFHDADALVAMQASFSGTLKNFLPFLLYGIVGMLLTLLGMLPLMLGLLIVMPVMIYSMYASYKDIYAGD